MRHQERGLGRGQGDRAGAGPSGNCVCPKCGHVERHKQGFPCSSQKCPKCHTPMMRR